MSETVRTFGKYLLDDEIARGGMSRVYAARLRGLGGFEKRLVVKQVLPELARDPRFVSMFVHEAKTLVQMSHPHIVPVYELGVVDGVYFLAMELVDGATLAAILREGPLAPWLVAHLGAEVCDALHYAHSRFDIVHRDVTPRNVIVDAAGHSRLLDFGIAAPLAGTETEVFGTPGYLSPEQLAGEAIGPASDVFALGAVLFEALTGRRAFDARTVEETREALEREGPRLEEDTPRELAAIVTRALARDPRERPASARELGRALRGWLASTHPEGVAPELGVRAERAEHEERRRLSVEPAERDERGATREVRTIATSRALDALLEGDGASEAPGGTVRIEGRGRARDDEGPGAGGASERADGGGAEASRNELPPPRAEGAQASREELPLPLAGGGTDETGADSNAIQHASPTPALPRERGRERSARADTTPSKRERERSARANTTTSERGRERSARADTTPSERERERSARANPTTSERGRERSAGARASGAPLLPWAIAAALVVALAIAIWPAEHAPVDEAPRPIAHPPPEAHADPDPSPPPAPSPEPEAAAPVEPPPVEPDPPAPRPTSIVSVNASPWAEVRLDGRAIGRTPQRRLAVRAGRHVLELTCPPLGRDVRYTFEAEPGRPLTIVADLEHDPPSVRRH